MDHDRTYYPYSWHQSHDQATVLIMIPYNIKTENISVVIERNYLSVEVEGRIPIVKGRSYGTVNIITSMWQLEPKTSRITGRERTSSNVSTTSTRSHSSYAYVSDPEISSSFAASIEGGVSETEDVSPPTGLSSPSLSFDERILPPLTRRKPASNIAASRSVSPGHAWHSMTSSYTSSLESLHLPHSGRLLTLYLEKDQPVIWPSLIVGPVPHYISPLANSVIFNASHELEHQYNMDPTSLVLIALEQFDIRKDKEEAFEYFLRAWRLGHVPSATMRLTNHYLPLSETDTLDLPQEPAPRGTAAYYLQCIGGTRELARLYLDAGLLHLEGAASTLLSVSYSSLTSIRMPLHAQIGESGTEAWKRDREEATKLFDRARILDPSLDVPSLADLQHDAEELEMPHIELDNSAPPSIASATSHNDCDVSTTRRRRKKEEVALLEKRDTQDDIEDAWYFYIPGLVGAGTALLVVGIVGALSLSSWSRRNQGP